MCVGRAYDSYTDGCECVPIAQIMKDMERWAKIQNRQKDSVRAASPVLRMGAHDDRRSSKAADAGFAVFERKVRERHAHARTHTCTRTAHTV